MTKKFNPKNSVCVITGGSAGIGQAIAMELLNRGASKIINIDIKPCDAYPNDFYECSVSDHGQLGMVLQSIINKYDVDLYCSNAGRCRPDNHEFDALHWQNEIDINFLPHVIAVHKFMPVWLNKNKGHILITASAAGITTMPGSATYAVTKSASIAYAEWLAMTYTTKGIATTVLCPKGVDTAMQGNTDFDIRTKDIVGPFLKSSQVSAMTLDAMQDGKFMVITHDGTAQNYVNKATNTELYIKQLQQLHDETVEGYNYKELYK